MAEVNESDLLSGEVPESELLPAGGAGGGSGHEETMGGGTGGPGGTEKIATVPAKPDPKIAEYARLLANEKERHQKQLLASSLSGGQYAAELDRHDPAAAEALRNRSNVGAAAEALSIASGAPFVGAHLDELAGAVGSGGFSGPEYEKKRNDARATIQAAQNYSPIGPVIGSLALGPRTPGTPMGRLAMGIAQGGAQGAGDAPSLDKVPRDAALGAISGLATSGVGELMRSGGSALGAKKQAVLDKNKAAVEEAAKKAFASARSGLGAETSSAMRTYEVLEKAANDLSLPDAVRQAAATRLDEPDMRALKAQIIQSHVGRSYDSAARIDAAKRTMADAGQALQPDAVATAAQRRIDDPSALMRRIRELGPKVVLPMIGGALAGPVGAGAGAVGSAALGRSGTTIRNAIADPYVSSRLLGAGESALGAAGRVVGAGAPRAAHESVEALDPEVDRWKALRGGQ